MRTSQTSAERGDHCESRACVYDEDRLLHAHGTGALQATGTQAAAPTAVPLTGAVHTTLGEGSVTSTCASTSVRCVKSSR